MKTFLCGVTALAFVAASTAFGVAATPSGAMMQCTGARGPLVWQATGSKTYVSRGNPRYGKGRGRFVCRGPIRAVTSNGSGTRSLLNRTGTGRAIAPRPAGTSAPGFQPTGSRTGTASRSRTTTTPARPRPAGTAAPGFQPTNGGAAGANAAGSSPGPVAPRPASTNAPGMPPASGGNTSPGAGNQGNTGAAGAGGELPNNPGSTSNNTSPSPHASPRP